jgi:hypothetical protein
MGMLNGYVKVVDDISDVDISAILDDVTIQQSSGSSGLGTGCCG